MVEPLILLNKAEEGITILTLNRPQKRNALNIALMRELCSHFESAQKDHSVRVLILNGTGPAFCSGIDLKEICEPHLEEESALLITKSLTLIYQLPCVTVAAVHGAAIAGGAGIMSACDLVIAASDLQCGFPEVKRGLVPAQISAVLHRQLSWRSLRELLLLGEIVDANHAKSLGLINKIVPPAELMPEALRQAEKVLKGAPRAIRETKKLLNQLYPIDFEEDLNITTPYHHRARKSEEAIEGAKAFLEKREPRWNANVMQ